MPFCKGVDCIVRNGWKYNKTGKKQRRKCTKCNKRFTEDNGFWKMKNAPETISFRPIRSWAFFGGDQRTFFETIFPNLYIPKKYTKHYGGQNKVLSSGCYV